ncbi:hypothetical protein L1F28_13940 [Arthrospira platensis NCB002]|uniref:hypothetical protein n=1 Tax=Limnospira platensis TaxID=118562 RepID=UPI0001D0E483|nr:hypothetical protein [Arthrospira platensis NCB002]WAK74552.1 hypothetical protein AP9108_34385 [Arthrospira sp. PCC 9108]BAI90584.1 hypothetical protein NIES39_E03570 [Arthrospira platensis NIES-39]BDT12884.1 hypothetical protein N39L_26070 [Arthrospira platensis NIES-39]
MVDYNQSPTETTIDPKTAIAPNVLTISPDATVEEAIALMSNPSRESDSSSIIVVTRSRSHCRYCHRAGYCASSRPTATPTKFVGRRGNEPTGYHPTAVGTN